MDSTLFVLNLDERFKCPVHGGLLLEPVKTTSGKNVCKACAQRGGFEVVAPNKDVQDDIDGLLCYCKYGTTTDSEGKLAANSKGCDHILKYGNKAQHEAQCPFRDSDSFVMVSREPEKDDESPNNRSVGLCTCTNKADGCLFLAESQSELEVHLNRDCTIERLKRALRASVATVQLLEREIQLRDTEIADLRSQVENTLAKKTAEVGKEVWEELVHIFGEEVPHGISSAKNQILLSDVFRASSTSLSNIKTRVMNKSRKVKKGIEELHPLEKLSDVNEKIIEMHPLDKLISLLSTLKDSLKMSYDGMINPLYGDVNNNNNNNDDINNNEILTTTTTTPISADDEDEEMKKLIAASLASYEEERKNRDAIEQSEAAAIAAAAALSLSEK